MTIALTVAALVAVGMVVAPLHRRNQLTGLTAGLSCAAVLAILVGALFVGGLLTRPPASAADENQGPRPAIPIETDLDGFQLPTL